MRVRNIIIAGIVICSFFSCVPLKQFSDTKKKTESLQDSNQLLKEENRELTVENRELDSKVVALQRKYAGLEKKAEQLSQKATELQYTNDRLSKNNDELDHQIALLKDGSSDEISKLLTELQQLQNDLQEREDKVKEAEDRLEVLQNDLNNKEQKLNEAETELAEQQARMMELQNALNKQQDAVTDLKEKLNRALRGFYDQGLSVHEKNGKVYVSLEEKLMFKTGSYSLDPKGQEALKSLGEVLASNPDINVMVEGHTDNVPLSGSGQIKDNWDLSVMRATAVAKIILANTKIDPKRITTAGRSEYVPLDNSNTAEGRRKNRRTEIILTPDLSEVFNIIQSN